MYQAGVERVVLYFLTERCIEQDTEYMIKVANAKTLVRSWVRKFPLEIGSPEGIGYPLQYSWASLVAQMVKNLPTTQETWV